MALTAAAPVAGLLLVELVLRVAGVVPVPNPRSEGSVVRASPTPGLGFQPDPGSVLVLDYGVGRPSNQRRVSHVYNSQGLRGPERPRERLPDRGPRIVCVGDSHTFGTGVAEQETWPARLAAALAARGCPRVEVLNAGVPGFDTAQEAVWLERAGLVHAPDLVLLQYFVNDTAARGLTRPGEPPPGGLVTLVHPRRDGWVATLRGVSRAADVLCDALYRHYAMGEHMQQLLRWHAPGDPGWELVKTSLLRARDATAAAGATFAVVLYPMLLRAHDGFVSRPALARVAAFCAGHQIAVFDGEPALLASDIPEERLRVAPGDLHAGAEAHAVFAGAVADWLAGDRTPFDLGAWREPPGGR